MKGSWVEKAEIVIELIENSSKLRINARILRCEVLSVTAEVQSVWLKRKKNIVTVTVGKSHNRTKNKKVFTVSLRKRLSKHDRFCSLLFAAGRGCRFSLLYTNGNML